MWLFYCPLMFDIHQNNPPDIFWDEFRMGEGICLGKNTVRNWIRSSHINNINKLINFLGEKNRNYLLFFELR